MAITKGTKTTIKKVDKGNPNIFFSPETDKEHMNHRPVNHSLSDKLFPCPNGCPILPNI